MIDTLAMPTCDADCTRQGWIELHGTNNAGGGYDAHLSVAPGTDLDTTFTAFSHDDQEPITINGWLWSWEPIDPYALVLRAH